MILVLLALAGCGDDTEETGPTEDLFPHFKDADGDGWGEPTDPGVMLPVGGDEAHPARNRLDCDDTTPLITGEIGDLCPKDLIGAEGVYAGLTLDAQEVFYIHGLSPKIPPATAKQSCGAWGGQLLTLSETAHFSALQADMLRATPTGGDFFVGIDKTGDSWAWSDGSTMALGVEPLPWCGEEEPPPSVALALIMRTEGTCLDAPPEGWLLCERDVPDPAQYVVYEI